MQPTEIRSLRSRSLRRPKPLRNKRRTLVLPWQLALLCALLAAWQWVPEIPGIRRVSSTFDPFFISSPSRVGAEIVRLVAGTNGISIVGPLGTTLKSTFIGTGIGTLIGVLAGLVLSNSSTLARVLRPFIDAANATPRIALIPIIIIIFGPTATASSVTAALLVIFIVFFNALEGGRSIPRAVIDNCRILGAGPAEIMLRVRLPYVLAWTFAAMPNAISFGLVGVVTAELLTGVNGMGGVLSTAINSVQATLTFGVVAILSVVGLVLVGVTSIVRQRVLHWWESGDGGKFG